MRSPVRSPVRSPAPPKTSPPKDFSYLLRPEIYHPLTGVNVPTAFRNSPRQPGPEVAIPDLLAGGHFRAAAVAAMQQLTGVGGGPQPEPSDHVRIFGLLYTRLACLTLIDSTALASQEVKALEDLNSAFYFDDVTGEHVVPWELRVLNVRLQALGFGDPRRAVMSYYDLAREARSHIVDATGRHDHSASELWKDRIEDLGIKVAGALVEMDDLTGAAAHLATLRDRNGGRLAMPKALLWLHLGDVEAARGCVTGQEGGDKIVSALCDMADGDYDAALATWRALRQEAGDDEMVGVNLAVCMLYVGKMEEVRLSPGGVRRRLKGAAANPPTGQGRAGEPGRRRLLVAHAALQPDDHVRAVHGKTQDAEARPGPAPGRLGARRPRLGEDERRLQIVKRKQHAISRAALPSASHPSRCLDGAPTCLRFCPDPRRAVHGCWARDLDLRASPSMGAPAGTRLSRYNGGILLPERRRRTAMAGTASMQISPPPPQARQAGRPPLQR